jgi:hypothetical protein
MRTWIKAQWLGLAICPEIPLVQDLDSTDFGQANGETGWLTDQTSQPKRAQIGDRRDRG